MYLYGYKCKHHEAFVINTFLSYTVHVKSAYMNSHAWCPQGWMANKLSIVVIRNIQGICVVDLVGLERRGGDRDSD